MSNINFVAEFRSFMRYAQQNGLSARERNLWIALFYLANDRARYNEQTGDFDWPDDFFTVANSELNLHSSLDKRGIDTVRNTLKQKGLIDFRSGDRNKRQPAYKIFYFSASAAVGYENTPNNAPKKRPAMHPRSVQQCTQEASSNAPRKAPLYINIDIDKYIDTNIGVDQFKKRFEIDDNYMESSRARAAVSQKLLDIIREARPELIQPGAELFDRINNALFIKLTPFQIYRMAGECEDWLDFIGSIEDPPAWAIRNSQLERNSKCKMD